MTLDDTLARWHAMVERRDMSGLPEDRLEPGRAREQLARGEERRRLEDRHTLQTEKSPGRSCAWRVGSG